jgi:hypothetical protein
MTSSLLRQFSIHLPLALGKHKLRDNIPKERKNSLIKMSSCVTPIFQTYSKNEKMCCVAWKGSLSNFGAFTFHDKGIGLGYPSIFLILKQGKSS